MLWIGLVDPTMDDAPIPRTTEQNPNVVSGELSGLRLMIYRYTVGVLREVLFAINSNRGLFSDEPLRATIQKLPADARKAWDDIVELAKAPYDKADKKRDVALRIVRMRSSLIFHYDDTKNLLNGYKKFSAGGGDPPAKGFLFLGEGVKYSRFLFADAAMQKAIETEVDGFLSSTEKEIMNYAGNVALVIADLFKNYMNLRKISFERVAPQQVG